MWKPGLGEARGLHLDPAGGKGRSQGLTHAFVCLPPPFPQLRSLSHQPWADCPAPLSLKCYEPETAEAAFWAGPAKGTRNRAASQNSVSRDSS